ncbi:unnamed protein product [Toxocara canis]|uniref:Ribosome biogenesis protein Alb1 n=1 Tax=Toxocara canis TaxID=6265 RepID=A0A183V051_TOXCA|nr:unnamed protein product [Toxocara canis]
MRDGRRAKHGKRRKERNSKARLRQSGLSSKALGERVSAEARKHFSMEAETSKTMTTFTQWRQLHANVLKRAKQRKRKKSKTLNSELVSLEEQARRIGQSQS